MNGGGQIGSKSKKWQLNIKYDISMNPVIQEADLGLEKARNNKSKEYYAA